VYTYENENMSSRKRHAAQHTTRDTQATNSTTHAHGDDLYIFNNISNNRRQQSPHPIILTADVDNIGLNIQ
jgi:hypothetical protein